MSIRNAATTAAARSAVGARKEDDPLPSWQDGPTKQEVLSFVDSVTDPASPHLVPLEARVAAFDNDGTLTCERPTVQGAFIMQRLAAMAAADARLAQRQPWKAAVDGDPDWVDAAVAKHYAGEDAELQVLLAAVLEAFSDMSVEAFAQMVADFFESARHPSLDRPFTTVVYQPMLELLAYLESSGFSNYIVTGGGRDFLRPISQQVFGIPPERVIGSAPRMTFVPGSRPASIVRAAGLEILDDGSAKPTYLWDRAGRRPILAAGNANGDIPLLQYASVPSEPSLRLLISHDDGAREYAYAAGAEEALRMADREGWTTVRMATDWRTVFPD